MATTGSIWALDEGYDIHVLRNNPPIASRRLLDILFIKQQPGKLVLATNPPPDVKEIKFLPKFVPQEQKGQLFSVRGVTVDTSTGEVTAGSNPGPLPDLRNFIIEPVVTRTNPDGTTTEFKDAPIRVHVHNSVTRAWLTPSILTVRLGTKGLRFSVLAQFDDDTVGDVTRHPDITWKGEIPPNSSSSEPSVTVDPVTGGLMVHILSLSSPEDTKVIATLPPSLGGKTAQGMARPEDSWDRLPKAAKLHKGPGIGFKDAKVNEVTNVLFLPDGFTNDPPTDDTPADRSRFDALVKKLIHELRTSLATSPFDLLSGTINYWSAFIPSRERGASALYDMSLLERRNGLLRGQPIPPVEVPQFVARLVEVEDSEVTPEQLERLIYEVGLPVALDDFPFSEPFDLAERFKKKLADWKKLFGPHVTGPLDGPNPLVRDSRIFNHPRYRTG